MTIFSSAPIASFVKGMLADSEAAQALDWLLFPLDKISLELVLQYVGQSPAVAMTVEDIQALNSVLSGQLALTSAGLAVVLLALTFAPPVYRPAGTHGSGSWRRRFFPAAAAGTLLLWSCMSVWGARVNHTVAQCAGPAPSSIAPVSATPLVNASDAFFEGAQPTAKTRP